jgi:hypothetical protein
VLIFQIMASRPSNEEIIEDLTKDLADTDICRDSDTRAFDDTPSPADTSSSASPVNDDRTKLKPNSSTSKDINEDDDDVIDEASLQDRDALLSDEEKEVNSLPRSIQYLLTFR